MKRRLFAAAMAMTMVIGASVPTMAETFYSDVDNGDTPDYVIDVKGTVVDTNSASPTTGDGYTDANDQSGSHIWNVEIASDDFSLCYQLDKTDQMVKTGEWGYQWNTDTRTYSALANRSHTDYTYTLHGNESGSRIFTIRNNSNFELGVGYSIVAGTNWDASDALTGLSNKNIGVAENTVTETVTLNTSLIPSSVNIADEESIGKINIELTAGTIAQPNV